MHLLYKNIKIITYTYADFFENIFVAGTFIANFGPVLYNLSIFDSRKFKPFKPQLLQA